MKLLQLTFLFVFSIIFPLKAEMISEKKNGALYIKSITTQELTSLYNQQEFFEFSRPRGVYPRIYLNHLPDDWLDVPENQAKQKIFIKILLPIVLKVNEEIQQERAEIEKINDKFKAGEKLSEEEKKVLEDKAEKYDVFTRMKGDERISILLNRLLIKVDVVPPSIMISTAAIYTDWGVSRLAQEGNALYRDEIWYQKDKGMKPVDDPQAAYTYQTFSSLEDCIRQRALKLNSHINYDYFREARRFNRQMNRPPYGPQVAAEMLYDSNLKNIAGLIDYTFTFFQLSNADFYPQLRDVK